MSTRTLCINGTGILTSEIKRQTVVDIVMDKKETVYALTKGYDEFPSELTEDYSTFSALEEAYDGYESGSGNYGVWGLVADIIAEETRIRVEYHIGDRDEAIVFCEGYPWTFNTTEQSLEIEDIDALFRTYFGLIPRPISLDFVG